MKKIGVILLCWNSGKDVASCLDVIKASNHNEFLPIVVDNNSNNNSIEVIHSAHPDTIIIANKENLGYANGNKIGIQKALELGLEYIWILNPDCTPSFESFDEFPKGAVKWGEALFTGLVMDNPIDKTVLFGGSTLVGNFITKRMRPNHFSTQNFALSESKINLADGMNLFFPISLFKKYEFMDESYFLYAEEHDWCMKLRKNGVPVIFLPKAIVYHKEHSTTVANEELTNIANYYRRRSILVFTFRYLGLFTFMRLLAYAIVSIYNDILFLVEKDKIKAWRTLALFHFMIRKRGKTLNPDKVK